MEMKDYLTKEEQAAFLEGYVARADGAQIDDNPYNDEFSEFRCWINGWSNQDIQYLQDDRCDSSASQLLHDFV